MQNRNPKLENLSPEARREMLARLLQAKRQTAKRAPLSFDQERFWFLDQLDPGSPLYNMPVAVRLRGPLRADALAEALNQVLQRHETLRTTFDSVDGSPVQVIAPNLRVTLQRADLQGAPPAERESLARERVNAEAQWRFDLAQGPLLRATLLCLAPDDHVLVLVLHHIISDGWSMGVLVRELTTFYQAALADGPAALPALPLQYGAYAAWQREQSRDAAADETLAYWKQQLAGPLPVLEMLTQGSAAEVPALRRRSLVLDPDLSAALRNLSRKTGVTLFVALLAAFKTLLYRCTGQPDIVIGSPIANRDRSELEPMIGFFINTLVLRSDLSGNPTFEALLRQVRQTVLDAFAHKDIPFARLVDELQPERDLVRNPIFQVVFILQNTPEILIDLPDLKVTSFHIDIESEDAPDTLGMVVHENPGGLEVILEYREDLLNQGVVEQFRSLLRAVVQDPQLHLASIPLLGANERQKLLYTWNQTQLAYPQERCFAELFEAQVACMPERVAAVCGAEQLSYAQLNRRANRAARALVERGVGPDTVVALLADRSLDFLTAILAVFKAGAAYLPLDPRHPASRLRQVLEQGRVPWVLFAEPYRALLDEVRAVVQTQVLAFADFLDQQQEDTNLPSRSTPRNLAYVIFTSGSTGVPKGAMLEQRGMINHLHAKIHDLALTDADVVAQNASQCFDISVWQFLAALLLGGRVEVFVDEIAHDPVRLLESVAQRGVTILEIVPSLMRAMLEQIAADASGGADLTTLRWLMPTGEALPPDLAREWLSSYPQCPIINAYGPTECSDDVTHGPLSVPPAADVMRMPIGSPIINTQIYVLDAQLEPLPAGCAGELYVGGDGVGRGYLHNPRKTAPIYIPDPFSSTPGARMYKTGDLACYREDGVLEFLGRVDYQVKIRGFRIELGEIDAMLLKHPDVRTAVTLAREDTPGQARLVAYVVPEAGAELSPEILRAALHDQLPEYMVPAAFVLLEAMPLTPNGKINRKVLPPPDMSQLLDDAEYVAPEGPIETRIAEIWAEILEVEQVGVYDDFFELGGHSLLAMRGISLINAAFKIKLSVRSLFEESTVAGLAMIVEEILLDELEDGDG